MKNITKIFLFIFLFFNFFTNLSFAENDIDLIFSPIKYELEVKKWDSLTKTAKIINKASSPKTIYLWKSNIIYNSNSDFKFVKDWESWKPNQEIASWISFNEESFELQPLEEKKITFNINVPNNAVPWWHYWAVFFKYKWEDTNNSWNTNDVNTNFKINADYWVLLLATVDWKIIDDWNAWDITIWWWSTWWGGWGNTGWNFDLEDDENVSIQDEIKKDDCIVDLTKSNFDGKCVDTNIDDILDTWIEEENKEKGNNEEKNIETDLNSAWEKINNNDDDFEIDFNIPFENKWNTHIKPEWEITLIDEDWKQIKWIWKQIIKDTNWVIIWEKIVDYLPINDNGSNVLPDSTTDFKSCWKWFPYENVDEDWKLTINFQNPSNYYSDKENESRHFLYPWERVCSKYETKKIKAIIKINYENYNWKERDFSSAKEFNIVYTKKYIWLNYYFFIACLWILFFFFLLFLIFRKKKKKCIKCKEKIEKKMKICPYCGKKQD